MERLDFLDGIHVLNRAEVFLRAFALFGNEETKETHSDLVTELARLRKLHNESEPGPKEIFRAEHPPLYDQLDACYDCGNSKCPTRGFKSKEDKEHHYKMWGIILRR